MLWQSPLLRVKGRSLTCASPEYSKGGCRSTSLKRKVPQTTISPLQYTKENPWQGQDTLPLLLGIVGVHPEPHQGNTDTLSGLIGLRHYTDHKTIVKAPRLLPRTSHMVLMVAPARPTPVTRLIHWFYHPCDCEIYRGLWNTKSQTKNISLSRVSYGGDTTPISPLERLNLVLLLLSLFLER